MNRIIFYKVAEQALTSNCGTDLKFRVFGNAPSGYQIKNYGREKREETKLNGHKVSTSHLLFLYLSLFQQASSQCHFITLLLMLYIQASPQIPLSSSLNPNVYSFQCLCCLQQHYKSIFVIYGPIHFKYHYVKYLFVQLLKIIY